MSAEDENAIHESFVDVALGTTGMLFLCLLSMVVYLQKVPPAPAGVQPAEMDHKLGDLQAQTVTLQTEAEKRRSKLEELKGLIAAETQRLLDLPTKMAGVEHLKRQVAQKEEKKSKMEATLAGVQTLEQQIAKLEEQKKNLLSQRDDLKNVEVKGKHDDRGGQPGFEIKELGHGRYRIGSFELDDQIYKALLSSQVSNIVNQCPEGRSNRMTDLERSLGWDPIYLHSKW